MPKIPYAARNIVELTQWGRSIFVRSANFVVKSIGTNPEQRQIWRPQMAETIQF